ncbi:hypothetical protein [Sphingobacterium wenxiniae]|uniref:Uncharacterized protein n=1 Tax=Sphingobacterium wenxiniae TaxID=683125 RepID=A0A1I6TW66_9SPHI|nr:hypothetical protein [Sphingobacterium wenxiniae]SFS93395.1 hypothetical protein SAMN05660206_10784 [Sphingobacterium wenxiniae]
MLQVLTRLILLYLVLSLCGCRSYKQVPNGFMVKGYPYFINVDERLTVRLDSMMFEKIEWQVDPSPLKAEKLSLNQKKLLRTLGYNTDVYAVLFKNTVPMGYQLIALVNTDAVSRDGREQLLDLGRMQRKVTGEGKWFEERIVERKNEIHHAVIPISEKLFEEKYLSLIYIFPKEESHPAIEKVVLANVSKFNDFGAFYGGELKAVESCPDDSEVYHHEYEIPEKFGSTTDYRVLKATDKSGKLVYYTLLNPGYRIGAFRICAGSYSLQYTTLDGEVVWEEEIIIG